MKNTFKSIFGLILLTLIAVNCVLFCQSISLSNEITRFEKETQIYHKKNLILEKELSYYSSLSFAQKMAKKMDFDLTSEPAYFEKLKFAYNH